MMHVRFLVSSFIAAAFLLGIAPVRAQDGAPGAGIAAPDDQAPPVRRKSRRRKATEVGAAAGQTGAGVALAGRYAVLREKRDTGCMITLDNARVKGGAVARLAPGCRDQGIVVFDPTMWALAQGELVLTARAGHKAHLMKDGDSAWKKDPKDGGKPLGLKRL